MHTFLNVGSRAIELPLLSILVICMNVEVIEILTMNFSAHYLNVLAIVHHGQWRLPLSTGTYRRMFSASMGLPFVYAT
jgi:hypothetical protein